MSEVEQPKIVSFKTALVPNSLGGAAIMVLGLGEDNKMYQWDGKNKKWIDLN